VKEKVEEAKEELKRLKNHWEDNRKPVLEKTSIDAFRTGSAE